MTALGGRYQLLALLGTGTAGSVYRANDLASGQAVAVKILVGGSPQRDARLEREGRVLRELGIPGVVRLLDEGVHDGRRFLVTELVDGVAFPGAGRTPEWDAVAPLVIRLFETLALVHAAGVIHRDLKPQNVLVDATGAPTVLDFGLSSLLGGNASLTATGDVVGTPTYQAPEQVLCDRPVDARADLYAVGVMIYEVLAGRSPQPARSLGGIYSARLVRDPPPLRSVAPQVPAAVARIVDRLVARDPEDRPGSARAVLDDLAGAAPIRPAGLLPWLGTREPIARIVAAARERRAIDVTGLRGAGRTRLLAEVAGELAVAGIRTARLQPGARPYESLMAALEGPSAGVPPDVDDLPAALRARLGAGDVLLVDDVDHVDAWTAALLETIAPDAGAVIRGAAGGSPREVVHLGPLSCAALLQLFEGSGAEPDADPPGVATAGRVASTERFAASLLHARTAGLASRVAAEVGAWVAAGHARWSGDQLVVSDEPLELLALGPPPDARLGRRSAPEALSEPLAMALLWVTLAEPCATLSVLAAARGRRPWEIEAELDALVARGGVTRQPDGALAPRPDVAGLVLSADDERSLALAAVGRAFPPGAAGRLRRLLGGEAWAEAAGEAERVAIGALEEGGFAVALAAARWGLRAAAESDEPVATATLRVLLARAAVNVGSPAALACAVAELRCAGSRHPSEPFVRALDAGDAPREAWQRGLEVAEALVEAGAHAEALREVAPLALAAERHRLSRLALHARWIQRAAAYRAGAPDAAGPDLRFVDEAHALGVDRLTARVCLTEAAVAWRAGRYEDGAGLARRAVAAEPGMPGVATPVATLARALVVACTDRGGADEARSLVAEADLLPDPAVGVQVRGLLALALPELGAAFAVDAERLGERAGRRGEIRAVLSCAEALAFCRASARRWARSAP
ncbi:MAG: serine/threonine-protein kinase [Pseudomonadota bacterium]|nr:serine/threonine-protein kinase [Pseudomonadota bacterium]